MIVIGWRSSKRINTDAAIVIRLPHLAGLSLRAAVTRDPHQTASDLHHHFKGQSADWLFWRHQSGHHIDSIIMKMPIPVGFFENSGMPNDLVHREGLFYHAGNGYDASSNVSGNKAEV